MQKWAYFTMGAMAGMIVLLLHALIMQHSDNKALAQGGAATVSGDGSIVMATGGSQSQINDIVWVLHEHEPLKALQVEDEATKDLRKVKHLSLMMYRCENQARSMKLVAARDISYDEELIDYQTEKPKVLEIFADLKKAADRIKDKAGDK
jgi:hypothetical protein